ncbi:MAG TPA: hypothetical protein VJQ56_01635 [Blastocatellia bacterium]|nr:hypothetical protein [Blastocatellia bacterium]
MTKKTFIALALLVSAACGPSAPPPARAGLESFKIISERADPSGESLDVSLLIEGAATEATVKSAAESVIESFKGQYKTIILKSFVGSATPNDLPYGVSKLERGEVTHSFHPEAATKKIPTH